MNEKTTKVCSRCETEKPIGHFSKDKSKRDGRRPDCRECRRGLPRPNRKEQDKKYRSKPENRFKAYQRSAKSRGFKWELTFTQFMKYWQKPCTHCGDPIETIGLDRIYSMDGYREGNVEPCCSKCNQMKSDFLTTDWYKHMEKIRKHSGGFVSAAKNY